MQAESNKDNSQFSYVTEASTSAKKFTQLSYLSYYCSSTYSSCIY